MNQEVLKILDQALEYSLWAFLFFFVILLLLIDFRLHAQRNRLGRYRKQLGTKLREQLLTLSLTQPPREQIPSANQQSMVVHALLFSGVFVVFFFLVTTFTPISFFENFSMEHRWQWTPLRLTSLDARRSREGFSLQGKVSNHTGRPLSRINALIEICSDERQIVDQVLVPVHPPTIAPGTSGNFRLRYGKNSPALYGYKILFLDENSTELSYLKDSDE